MVTDILLLIIALIALIFASIVDIKIKEVPNWISYNLIIVALAIRLISSITTKNYNYITDALIAVIIVFIIAEILYHIQIWGGGDSKLLIGLSAVFATSPTFLNNKYPFLLLLLPLIFLSGAIYGLIWAIVLTIKNKKEFLNQYKKLTKLTKIRTIKIFSIILGIILIILLITQKQTRLKPILALLVLILITYTYLWKFAKAVENCCMYTKIKVSKLVEGDWIAKDIKYKNKIIYKKTNPGVKKEDITTLKKYKIKEVIIKQGIPFVPSFLIGTILAIILTFII